MKRLLSLLVLIAWSGLAPAQTATLGPGQNPCLHADRSGRLWMAYEKSGDIWLRSSSDSGQSWTAETPVCQTAAPSRQPTVVVGNSGVPAVLWLEDGQVVFAHAGEAPVTLSNGKAADPDLALANDDSLHAVWIELASQSPDVFYGYSNNGGKSWTHGLNLSHTPGISSHPRLSADGDMLLHVAWLDTTSGAHRPDVFAVHGSQDTWTTARNVSNTAGLSQAPEILATASNQVYLAWMDNSRSSSVWDIYFARSQDSGNYTQPIFFDTPAQSTDPTLAASGSERLGVAWVDTSHNAASPDIFLAQSGDGGKTFTLPLNISQSPGVSRVPSMACVDEQFVVVWEELEGGQNLLKFTRHPFQKKPRQPVSSGKY
ncbi:MAG: sialidase family protein [Vulcanimicrobiota bacterium]